MAVTQTENLRTLALDQGLLLQHHQDELATRAGLAQLEAFVNARRAERLAIEEAERLADEEYD
jgi:2,3-bisphosphoglycerate-independent phosphoglycerate mutase